MRIKTKLTLGVGLLFTMITLLTVLSVNNINRLSKDAKNILADNYNTIDYCRQMLIALNQDISSSASQTMFEKSLNRQEETITEKGEKELTNKVIIDFAQIKVTPFDTSLSTVLRKDITDIMFLNMKAIQKKSDIAEKTAKQAIWWISIAGSICFLIAFILLINLPTFQIPFGN